MKNGELKEKILEAVDVNHMWINAFMTIRPTDDLKMQIGEWVLSQLRDRAHLLPPPPSGADSEDVNELMLLCPSLYVRFNAS